MQPYATATGTRSTLDALAAAGWGMLVTPDAYAPGRVEFALSRGMPIAIDNGAYAAFMRGESWQETQRARFVLLVDELGALSQFVVAPDIVAGGAQSLELSLRWIPWLLDRAPIVLLAVQDGMTDDDVRPILDQYDRVGIFLGGSTSWKWNTAAEWGALARQWGRPFHVARVNSQRRIRQAGTVGATSWDGTGPVQFPSMLPRLQRGQAQGTLELLGAPAPCCARPDLRADEFGVTCVECGEAVEPGAYGVDDSGAYVRSRTNPPAKLWPRFSHLAAPEPGRKGYRAPPALVAGALDGRNPYEVASTMLHNARVMNDWPELTLLLGPLEDADVPGVWREFLLESELADHVGVPFTDHEANPLDAADRYWWAYDALVRANEVSFGEYWPDSAEHQRAAELGGGWAAPEWLAVAELADKMTPSPGKPRLVAVPKREAYEFVKRHHSKLGAGRKLPPGIMYAIGVRRGHRLVAVGLVNSPTGRFERVDPRNVIELTRVASDGTVKGAASMIAARAIDLLELSKRGDPDGDALFVTYQFQDEAGTPYRALRDKGLRPVAIRRADKAHGARAGGGGRVDEAKIVWHAGPAALPPRWELVNQLALI